MITCCRVALVVMAPIPKPRQCSYRVKISQSLSRVSRLMRYHPTIDSDNVLVQITIDWLKEAKLVDVDR